MSELLCNYLGNYKNDRVIVDTVDIQNSDCTNVEQRPQDNTIYSGPVIISSNNYYSYGDLLTFRYMGVRDNNSHIHNLLQQRYNSGPVHLRYHTISTENPILLVHADQCTGLDNIMLEFKITCNSTPPQQKYINISNHSDNTYMDIYINMDMNDMWIKSSLNQFNLSSEPLIMIVITPQYNQHKSFVIILEASECYDQNLPNSSELAFETYVENLVQESIDNAVQQVLFSQSHNQS